MVLQTRTRKGVLDTNKQQIDYAMELIKQSFDISG
jgi:predicted transport protein